MHGKQGGWISARDFIETFWSLLFISCLDLLSLYSFLSFFYPSFGSVHSLLLEGKKCHARHDETRKRKGREDSLWLLLLQWQQNGKRGREEEEEETERDSLTFLLQETLGVGIPVTLQNKSTFSPFLTAILVLLGETVMEGGTVWRRVSVLLLLARGRIFQHKKGRHVQD